MNRLASIAAFSLLFVGCASHRQAQSDFYFLPCAPKASVSFEGETQSGRGIHRLEVRRLAFMPTTTKTAETMQASCVIYYAGDDYGPYILDTLDECIEPLVRKVTKDEVEIYFSAGAHTHFRQRWRLLGSTAKLEKQEAIDWSEDPRMMPNQGAEANRRHAEQSDGSDSLSATLAADRAFPAAVTKLDR